MQPVFGHTVSAFTLEYLVAFRGQRGVDLNKVVHDFHDQLFREAPPQFTLTRRAEPVLPMRTVHARVAAGLSMPVEEVARHFRISGVYERQVPSASTVTRAQFYMWKQQGRFTNLLFVTQRHHFLSFLNSVATCVTLAEIVSAEPTLEDEIEIVPSGFFPTRELCVQKGLDTECRSLLKVSRPRVLIGAYRLDPSDPLETVAFVQESVETLGFAYPVEYDAASRAVWIRTAVLLLDVEIAPGVHDAVVLNPWATLLSGGKKRALLQWKDLWNDSHRFVTRDVLDIKSLTSLARYVGMLEENFRRAWTILPDKVHATPPDSTTLVGEFVHSYVMCMDLQSTSTTPAPPNPLTFTRPMLVDMIRATADKHACHLMTRAALGSAITVSIVTAPVDQSAIVYVTVMYPVGVQGSGGGSDAGREAGREEEGSDVSHDVVIGYKLEHLALITNDATHLREFLHEHWDEETKWIEDASVLKLALRLIRAHRKGTTRVPPIPVGRVYFHDEGTPGAILKNRWKLAGCGCVVCKARPTCAV